MPKSVKVYFPAYLLFKQNILILPLDLGHILGVNYQLPYMSINPLEAGLRLGKLEEVT
jgi:hypothetical protein